MAFTRHESFQATKLSGEQPYGLIMLRKKSPPPDRYCKLYISSYICHTKYFYRQLNYNHVQQAFYYFRENYSEQKQKIQEKFLVSLECQTRRNSVMKKSLKAVVL